MDKTGIVVSESKIYYASILISSTHPAVSHVSTRSRTSKPPLSSTTDDIQLLLVSGLSGESVENEDGLKGRAVTAFLGED